MGLLLLGVVIGFKYKCSTLCEGEKERTPFVVLAPSPNGINGSATSCSQGRGQIKPDENLTLSYDDDCPRGH